MQLNDAWVFELGQNFYLSDSLLLALNVEEFIPIVLFNSNFLASFEVDCFTHFCVCSFANKRKQRVVLYLVLAPGGCEVKIAQH